jgi:hypothetical protein
MTKSDFGSGENARWRSLDRRHCGARSPRGVLDTRYHFEEFVMSPGRIALALVPVLLLPLTALAEPKDCEELKAEIAAKIDAKGVKTYTLEIVDAAAESTGTVVGSCQAGTKKIVYTRG